MSIQDKQQMYNCVGAKNLCEYFKVHKAYNDWADKLQQDEFKRPMWQMAIQYFGGQYFDHKTWDMSTDPWTPIKNNWT